MRILIIEDSNMQRRILKMQLGEMGHDALLADEGRKGIDLFQSSDPDLVLLDVEMPGINGFETARIIRSLNDEWVPIIFLSGHSATESIESGIDAGGDDYLTKPVDPKVLEAKIRSMKRISQMRRQLVERGEKLNAANAALMRLAEMDGLTGIANRRRLDSKIQEEISRGARGSTPLSLILLDIDHFKRFNDMHGHLNGDECLKKVAKVLEANQQRPADLVARYGGEEFCMVLPETDAAGASQVAERLRTQIENTKIELPDGAARISASFGVATTLPAAGTKPTALLSTADAALYNAKRGGRNRVCAGTL